MKLLDEIALAGLENISIEDILEYETIEALSAYMEETNKRELLHDRNYWRQW